MAGTCLVELKRVGWLSNALDHLQHPKRQGRHAGRLLCLVVRAHPASGEASDGMGLFPKGRVDRLD